MKYINMNSDKRGVWQKTKTVLFLSAFIVLIILGMNFALANHTSEVTIDPDIVAGAVDDETFTVTACNDAGDDVHEFRIYYEYGDFTEFTDVQCQSKSGWNGPYIINGIWGDFCLYTAKTSSDEIGSGECEDFVFTADTPATECCRTLRFETRDVNDYWVFVDDEVCVDTTPPETQKWFNGPQKIDGDVEWIDGVSTVELYAEECGPHPSEPVTVWYQYKNLGGCCTDPCYFPDKYCNGGIFKGDGLPDNWQEYTGTPINDFDESCHVFMYYSEDGVGNEEDVKFNCFFVDKTPPRIDKCNGDAIYDTGESMFTTNDNPEGEFHWLTTSMPVTFTCVDEGPHPSEDEELCFKVSYDYPSWGYITDQYCDHSLDDGYCCEPVDGNNEFVFYFDEESMHNLEYFCKDAVDKKTDVHVQYYKVDDTPPSIEKEMLGVEGDDWIGDCPPDDISDVCYVADNDVGGVSVDVIDGGEICAVDDVDCFYELWWETDSQTCIDEFSGTHLYNFGTGECFVEGGQFSTDTEILFHQDSTHRLYIECVDALGNKVTDEEFFLVDSLPPVTTKTYLGPYSDEPCCSEWIDTKSTIKLDAEDNKVGVEETLYRVTQVSDEHCTSPNYCQTHATGSGDFVTYTEPFGIAEESCHLIEYYSVDFLGNKEVEKKQCVFVDKTAPVLTKEVGEPKIPCEGEECDFWIQDHVTPITLSCEDAGPHPSNYVTIHWRYNVDGGEWIEGSYSTAEHMLANPSYICVAGQVCDPIEHTIIFEEDSVHTLEAWCEDAVEKTSEKDIEIFKVDSVPPTTEKEYLKPFFDDEGVHYIDGASLVELTAEDGGEICAVGVDKTYYHYMIVDNEMCSEECYIDEGECEGWGCLDDLEKDFFVTGRYGNQGSLAQTWELAIWERDGGTEYVRADDGADSNSFDWTSGVAEDFLLSYDPSDGSVVFTVGAKTLEWTYDSDKYFEYMIPFAKGNANGNSAQLTDMRLNGKALPDLDSGTTYMGYKVLMGDGEQLNGFVLTGKATLNWAGNPKNELPAFHIFVMNTHDFEWYEYEAPFSIPDESCHLIRFQSIDLLGNAEDVQYQCVFVDKTPPVTEKSYGEPRFPFEMCEESYPHWISSQTDITMEAIDPEPHPSGVDYTKYRVTLLDDDKYCEDFGECMRNAIGTGDFMDYTGAFQIGEESCHLIEYYSVDMVEKPETVKKQCVFVDNTPPEPNKTVGEPRDLWTPGENGDPMSIFYPEETAHCWDGTEDEIECWEVTMTTPIDLECVDQDPHPVDNNEICFMVGLDGEDATGNYCGFERGFMTDDGYCCIDDERKGFMFREETEHNLKYYCVDALGNEGEIDEEKFKVTGTKFEIPLFKKWNLISVPFVLLNDDPEVVFESIADQIESVWTYDPEHVICGDDWCVWSPNDELPDNLRIKPGWGYWVLAKNGTTEDPLWLVIGGSLFNQGPVAPPSRDLQAGWNLIGYYGASWELYDWGDFNFMCGDAFDFPDRFIYGDKVYCALNSLIDTQEGYPKWSSLWSFLNCGDHHTFWMGLNTCADQGIQQALSRMYAGRGYWIEMDVEDMYAPATTCVWNDDYECRLTGGGIMP